jgi:CBS domain-containing protein
MAHEGVAELAVVSEDLKLVGVLTARDLAARGSNTVPRAPAVRCRPKLAKPTKRAI